MKITHYAHNTFGIEVNGVHILVDPFITGNEKIKDKFNIHDLQADYILLTHAHQDHTLDAEAIARNTGAVIVSNYEIARSSRVRMGMSFISMVRAVSPAM